MGRELFQVLGVDLEAYATAWVAELESDVGRDRSLLILAESGAADEHTYRCGARYAMANIAPRAAGDFPTREESLLFAVLAVFQEADLPGVDPRSWEGLDAHVRRALTHFHEVGVAEAGRRISADLARRSRQQPFRVE